MSIQITFQLADGTSLAAQAEEGDVLMRIAKRDEVPGILAECGGVCSCATCHVHVDAKWFGKLPPPEEMETEMLEFAEGVDATSRLACQIKLSPEMDGLIVHVPESQY